MNKDKLISGVVEHVSSLMGSCVTMADIKANIVDEYYFTAMEGALNSSEAYPSVRDKLELLTFCVLVLRNGFTVVGESACVSPENFDAALGRKIARENAVKKVWPLMGYELKTKLQGTAD